MTVTPQASSPPGSAFPARTVAVMIVLGYLPLLHVAAVVALCALPLFGKTPLWVLALAPAALYLVPPLAVRLAVLIHPLPNGRCEIGSAGFLVWWLTAQWQILFTRLPALEELLRLVPGLYSSWLRLWGARIGRLVYWSPGVLIFDRPLVEIGDRVILGACLRIVPHFIGPDEEGRRCLIAAPVKIGSNAIVGGHAVVAPGVEIAPGAVTIATRSIRPFAVVKGPEAAETRPSPPAKVQAKSCSGGAFPRPTSPPTPLPSPTPPTGRGAPPPDPREHKPNQLPPFPGEGSDCEADAPQVTWYDEILRQVPSGVDISQLEELLKLTPTERLQRMQKFLEFLEEAKRPDHSSPQE